MISVELACIGREEFVGTMRRSSQVAWLLLGGARKTKIVPKLYLTIGTGPEKNRSITQENFFSEICPSSVKDPGKCRFSPKNALGLGWEQEHPDFLKVCLSAGRAQENLSLGGAVRDIWIFPIFV